MVSDAERGLGDSLRGLRLARGLSLDATALRSGLAKSTLSKWESGANRPRGAGFARLLDALEAEPRLRARLLHAADPQFAQIELTNTALGAPVDVGMVIRAMRGRHGLTQASLAQAVGVAQATVARWESADLVPSGEALHAVGFALGASVEETVALACAEGRPSGRLPDAPPAPDRYWRVLPSRDSAVFEVAALGLEAELWARAVRDAQWDPWLGKALGERSLHLFLTGRLDEAATTARRALGIGSTPEVRLGQTFAFSAPLEIATLQGADSGRLAAKIGGWAARLPDGQIKGWMFWEQALRLAEVGRADDGIDLTERMAVMSATAFSDGESLETIRLRGLLEVELRAGRADRAEDLVGRLKPIDLQSIPIWSVRIAHLRGEAADDVTLARACEVLLWHSDHWYARRKVASIERKQARLVGAPLNSRTRAFPNRA